MIQIQLLMMGKRLDGIDISVNLCHLRPYSINSKWENMKKYFSIISYFLIIIGVAGVIVTVGYDFFRPGEPNFGEKQLMGFVGSTMILLAGVSKLSNNKKDFWHFFSLFIYIAGMFFLVLLPHHYHYHSHKEMLGLKGFFPYDFSFNVIGFMPLGYLLMSLLAKFSGKYRQTMTILFTLLFGVLLSFLIEIGQYYIPGRISSLIDVAANGTGSFSPSFWNFTIFPYQIIFPKKIATFCC
jgi:glycopeptide antibiotics resistance protein